MSENLPPTLCLDGTAIRRIREEKKLTQLYVAKVVGVTTDTVSRWENNRYPSIKRENVLRLAEALEVPFEEILQRNEGEASPAPPPARTKAIAVGAAALLLIVIAFFILRSRESSITGITAERLIPPHAAPGSVLPVRIRLQVDGGGKGFILREHFSPGWTLVEASPPPSRIDRDQGTARWIIRSGEPRTIAYLLRLPAAAKPDGEQFRGEIVAGAEGQQEPVPVGGAAQITVSPFLWADMNADLVIDDGEMLQASYLFEEMKGVTLDWRELEAIWDAGGYRWDPAQQIFVPLQSSPN